MSNETITLYFYGICMHTLRGDGHRAILVNASDPARWAGIPALEGVHAHRATLRVAEGLVTPPWPDTDAFHLRSHDNGMLEWDLNGVILTFGTAAATAGAPPDETCIPTLGGVMIDPPPPPLRTDAANPVDTACFVDFPRSAVSGGNIRGSAVAIWTIAVSDQPMIQIEEFTTGTSYAFPVNPSATIFISNIPVDTSADKPHDFYLYFLNTQGVPSPAQLKEPGTTTCEEIVEPPGQPPLGEYTGPGCSNSNYP
ncbi:MAG TPA: hypothetical protein VMU84_06600 [Thermoanaerobaculia bacterium]|nr:hypothetical protein [Thermoanaerobaculia bacterium]